MNHRIALGAAVALCLFPPLSAFAVAPPSGAPPAAAAMKSSAVVSLDGPAWLLAPDAANGGQQQRWWQRPAVGAKPTPVPWIIQEVFPGYHGVAWYWRDFVAPANPHAGGRYLLRFWAVDYLADVWLNGVHLGRHEGGEAPFVFDATPAVKPGAANRLAVRVLNPTIDGIDGFVLRETPGRNKSYPCKPGCDYNYGGITDSVELLVVPAVRIEDLFVRPDPTTGRIHVRAVVRNAGTQAARTRLAFSVAPAAAGETLDAAETDRDLPPGDTPVETELAVEHPRLWQLNDPWLYRVTARASAERSASFDEQSTRCGFRDFRLAGGYFRLNGRRIYLKSSHTGADVPIGLRVAADTGLLRRDLLNCKVMGFNMIRFIAGVARRDQLDLCDEIGLLVYEENFASWQLRDSPHMGERFDDSTLAMVRRDRNHASLVMWGLLNETPPGAVFARAVAALPKVRDLDPSRVVMLNSGGWDKTAVGKIANPGSWQWQNILTDLHPYQRLPHDAAVIRLLRTIDGGGKPLWLSEYGVGSAVDLPRLARQYEQRGKTACEDAACYRRLLDRFLADWDRWRLSDTFANPEDYFRQCLGWMAGLRQLGINAIRANPNVIGYSLTGTQDQGLTGEGLTTTFRELKPGTVDAMSDALAPLRWCLFVEPVEVYRGHKARFEAVLANEDVLGAGDYPVRFQIVGPRSPPHTTPVFDRTITIHVPDLRAEPPFALPVFAQEIAVDGPAGKYRFLATFERGGAAAGGQVDFDVADAAEMPPVETEVVLWGDDALLAEWLGRNGIKTRPFGPGPQRSRQVILAGAHPAPGGGKAFGDLARRIAQGSTAVFLCPEIFEHRGDRTHWLPLAHKGQRIDFHCWLYHKDDWAKLHPIFDGLPAGCILDHAVYREVVPASGWTGQDVPDEAVAGAIDTSLGYRSGLTVAVYRLDAGRFILSTWRLRENLGRDPVAERLLRNLLRHAARDTDKPPVESPPDVEKLLTAMGY